MRVVYRLAPAMHARDLSGSGARLKGGRWNQKDTPIIYTSESRSLAGMEYLVHVAREDMPDDMKMVSIGIPAAIVLKELAPVGFPAGWRNNPPPFELAAIGTRWVMTGGDLLLRVPSAVTLHEFNILINPSHPDMKFVKIMDIEDFAYDPRLDR
jgi:RES domain-containing protein